ncbi:hypothetical protein F2P81_001039 [Scophthalmus maximus]|uniref:Uncharacterized protein n=1 Tax=Scophthalmus maximus TaxID=52904 RepID=A0A6A4TIR1_SCOMX|nr:hypothetical protein F2P81_001039 [Scophthalmus maximus]
MLSLLQSDFKVSFESLTTLHDNVTSKVTVAVWLLMPVSLLEQPIQIDRDVWIHKSNSEMTVYNESINCQLFMMLQHYRITTHITTHFLIRIEWLMLCHNDGEQVRQQASDGREGKLKLMPHRQNAKPSKQTHRLRDTSHEERQGRDGGREGLFPTSGLWQRQWAFRTERRRQRLFSEDFLRATYSCSLDKVADRLQLTAFELKAMDANQGTLPKQWTVMLMSGTLLSSSFLLPLQRIRGFSPPCCLFTVSESHMFCDNELASMAPERLT